MEYKLPRNTSSAGIGRPFGLVYVVVPRTYFSTPQTLNGVFIQTKFKDEKMIDGRIMPGLSMAVSRCRSSLRST